MCNGKCSCGRPTTEHQNKTRVYAVKYNNMYWSLEYYDWFKTLEPHCLGSKEAAIQSQAHKRDFQSLETDIVKFRLEEE